ncbi:hypothetical protein BMS3Abin17_00460 [archaeon BMS3Abin17]|nr:hypothetical protein BMS3Abin17_00460 [archaeon BMS3Abin17]HDZ61471.1 hypothetical protein [Candidatus Pacearchaeota archaeon]
MTYLDEFMKHIPRANSTKDKMDLVRKGEPFIENISFNKELCYKCKTETNTKKYTVHVPSEEISIKLRAHHYDSVNPTKSCRDSYIERLCLGEGAQELVEFIEDLKPQLLDIKPKELITKNAQMRKIRNKYKMNEDKTRDLYFFIMNEI